MKRAAAYARYSTDSQDEKSIAYQMNAIEEYCLYKGYEIVGKYADEAFSGTTQTVLSSNGSWQTQRIESLMWLLSMT